MVPALEERAVSKLGFLSVIVLSIALSGAAYAARGGGHGGGGHGGGGHGGGGHFGGGHIGGGHFGGGHFRGGGRHFSAGPAISRSAGRTGFHGSHSLAVGSAAAGLTGHNASVRATAVRHALVSGAVAGALHNHSALRDPGVRAHIAANAATAGWHDRRGGWWRHGNGGYGWVGPLFWPFAYYDMYDYAMWGDDLSFWDYGYGDIYAGLFAPYDYDALAGYLPSGGTAAGTAPAESPAPDQLSQMCGEDSRDIAGLPIDQIQQALQPNDTQRAALDDLANASVKAAPSIKAACPTKVSLTAPDRLAAMQTRIQAMIAAVGIVQPPLDHFYGLLDDEQKARLTALGQDKRREQAAAKSLAQSCTVAQPGETDWPAAEIESRLHPTDAQRASLTALQDASAKAVEMLKTSCQTDIPITPPARLAAVGKRLGVMLQAVNTVSTALDNLYAKLTDEQKAQFEAIGPGRTGTASSDESTSSPRHYRRHHASVGGIVRRLISIW
jgi:hypothetical protein